MSRKTRAKKEAQAPDPLTRRLRLAGLAALVVLQWCCIIGSRGPWWQPLYRGQPFGDPTVGQGDPWGGLIILASFAGFFFASYDLLAGEDIQWPILLTTLLVALGAGQVFHRVWWSEATIESVAEEVGAARALGLLPPDAAPISTRDLAPPDPGRPGDQVEVAPIEEQQDVLTSGGLSLRFRWGLALVLAAAPLMVLVSAALTFLARRAPEPAP